MDTERSPAPRPGDPRSLGPRPPGRLRDVVWAGLALLLALLTVAQLVTLFVTLVRLDRAPSTGGTVLGFVITVVWLMTVYWLVMGAWRRSVWGCPFPHEPPGPDAHGCPRHGSVDGPMGG